MKEALKMQFLTAVSLLLIAAIALTGATYAWFTTVANPTVGTIDLYVKAAEALFLSELPAPAADNMAHWKALISQDEIVAAQPLAFPDELFNVSTAFTAANHDFFIAEFNADGSAITGYTAAAATPPLDYAKFSLWAKSSSTGAMTLEKTIANPASVTAIDEGGNEIFYPASVLAGIAYTVRIGIVPRTGATENWAEAVIWEPNSTAHLGNPYRLDSPPAAKEATSAAVLAAGAPGTTGTQTTYDFGASNTRQISRPAEGTYGAWTCPLEPDKIQLFYLEADSIRQFNVYIWVEGADKDTLTYVAQSYFRTLLRFGIITRS